MRLSSGQKRLLLAGRDLRMEFELLPTGPQQVNKSPVDRYKFVLQKGLYLLPSIAKGKRLKWADNVGI